MNMDIDLSGVSTLVFDIGGVLVRLHGTPFKPAWIGEHCADRHVWQLWRQSTAVPDFERGLIDEKTFARRLIEEAGLNVSVADLLDHFLQWPKALFDGMADALRWLKPHYRLAALSNSNALHWPRVMDGMGIGNLIDDCYSSHHLGVMKPNAKAFAMVITELGVAPEEILFLDDLQKNVDAAFSLGMQSVKVTGTEGVHPVLEGLGLLRGPAAGKP